MEQFAIFNYDTYCNGYNSTIGGDSNPSKNPDVARKISQSLKGKKQPRDVVEKRRAAMIGKKMFKGSDEGLGSTEKIIKYVRRHY